MLWWPRRNLTHTATTAAIYMIRTVLYIQDVPVASGLGPLTTQLSGHLQMQSAAANLVMARHVLNLQLLITPMATPVAVFKMTTVLWTQVALAVTGLGLR